MPTCSAVDDAVMRSEGEFKQLRDGPSDDPLLRCTHDVSD